MSERPETTQQQEAPRPRRIRRKKTPWEKFKEAYLPLILLALAVILVVSMIVGIAKLAAGSGKPKPTEPAETVPVQTEEDLRAKEEAVQNALDWAEKLAATYDYDGALAVLNGATVSDNRIAQAISDYSLAKQTLQIWEDNTEVPMISFQPMVVDTDRAFDGDDNSSYYNRTAVTIDEFREILKQLYAKGFVAVNMADLASERSDGTFAANEILLPEGKKPIILSLVPAHYTALKAGDGFARRLALDGRGNVTCEYIDSSASKLTGAYDFVSILEEFVAEHPDFSYHGARAVLGISGDDGPLGYKLTDENELTQLKNLSTALKNLGYEFACFTYDSIRYGDADAADVKEDVQLWLDTYKSVLGDTKILIYAGGSDLEEYEGEKYDCLHEAGFRYFCGLDNSVTSWIKITEEYLRCDRRTINGSRIMEDGDLVEDLFDADTVVSGLRP